MAPESRGQRVLWAKRWDEVLAANHPVRMLYGVHARLDWSVWEAACVRKVGQSG